MHLGQEKRGPARQLKGHHGRRPPRFSPSPFLVPRLLSPQMRPRALALLLACGLGLLAATACRSSDSALPNNDAAPALPGAHGEQPSIPSVEEDAAPTTPPTSPEHAPSALPTAASPPTTQSACASRATVKMPNGSTVSCYPYVCRNGACLKSCRSELDCAGAHSPAEMAKHGYPLECMPSGRCVPMPPEKLEP